MRRHQPETAAQHLTAAVARARPDELVGEVRLRLIGHALEDTESVCVVDADGRLLGLLDFADLFWLPADAVVEAVIRRAPPDVQAHEDQEKVASIALHYGLNSVPVVDAGRRLLGVVPARALLAILRRARGGHPPPGGHPARDQRRPPRARCPAHAAGTRPAAWLLARMKRDPAFGSGPWRR